MGCIYLVGRATLRGLARLALQFNASACFPTRHKAGWGRDLIDTFDGINDSTVLTHSAFVIDGDTATRADAPAHISRGHTRFLGPGYTPYQRTDIQWPIP